MVDLRLRLRLLRFEKIDETVDSNYETVVNDSP